MELKRVVGFFTLTMYGVGTILGAGVYSLIGQSAGKTGFHGREERFKFIDTRKGFNLEVGAGIGAFAKSLEHDERVACTLNIQPCISTC